MPIVKMDLEVSAVEAHAMAAALETAASGEHAEALASIATAIRATINNHPPEVGSRGWFFHFRTGAAASQGAGGA